jgi:hypothetical protein
MEPAATAAGAMPLRSTGLGRPPLAVIAREGDPRGAVAVAVSTEGLAEERGALPGAALAALVQERLATRGVEATAIGGWNGWRMRALVASPAEAASVVDAVREAMLAPVSSTEAGLVAAARRAEALRRRPLPDPALVDPARCTGDAFGMPGDGPPTVSDVEAWRASAHGLGRIGIATAGPATLADAVARALAAGPVWPQATPVRPAAWPAVAERAAVYDAAGELSPGSARIVLVARTATPERAVAAAPSLGDPRGPLASRLAALEAPGHVRTVAATAHVDGGCVAVTVDLAGRDLGAAAPARVATAAALARQELAEELADAAAPLALGRTLPLQAADPGDAAEQAAWWTLAGRRFDVPEGEVRATLTVGIAPARDAAGAPDAAAATAVAIRAEIDRATVAWHAAVVEGRMRVERGQGEVWVLLASPCGTVPEALVDAGTGAVMATAAATQASAAAGDARVEPFVAPDGVGLLAHGPARAGETPQAHARRIADLAARTFAAEALDPARTAQARTALLARAGEADHRALATLAGALAPGHPAWVWPSGTSFGLASASDEATATRAAAVRAGPLRVAVIANVDEAQADAAVRAVDRWIARRPGEARTCPSPPAPVAPRAGTYAVDRPAGRPSEAWVAAPLPAGDDGARAAAAELAAALDGPDGLLARALAGTPADRPEGPLALDSSAQVVGSPRAAALVLRVSAPDTALDGAVAQARGLLDRLRHGALREEDRARAEARLARARLATALDPRQRAVALWRGEGPPPAPSLDELRSLASAALVDDALVIVASRPQRPPPAAPARPPPAARDPKGKSRE